MFLVPDITNRFVLKARHLKVVKKDNEIYNKKKINR